MSLFSEYAELDELGGRRFRQTIHLKPIAYRKNGNLRRIGNALAATGDSAFPIGVDELCQFRVDPRIAGKSPLIHFGKGSQFARFALVGANNIAGEVNANRMFFRNAWNNADLEYILAGHRLQESIYLRAGHPRSFGFVLQEHTGFDPQTLDFGAFRILDPVLEPPAGSDKLPIALRWLVSSQGGKYQLTVALPDGDWAGWMIDPTLTLQPNAADGLDSFLLPASPNNNYSTTNYLQMATGGSNQTSVIQFDLTTIPTATILSATFTGTSIAGFNGGSPKLSLYRILAAADWIEAQVTWNSRKTATSWPGSAGCSTAGTDYDATPVIAVGVAVGPNTGDIVTIAFDANGVADVQAMLLSNTGFRLKSTGWSQIASSDHATALLRPKLTVDYTVGGLRWPVIGKGIVGGRPVSTVGRMP